ncbi:MAG: hypothetical protein AAGD38_02865 [Acidobacteriota bacterium]
MTSRSMLAATIAFLSISMWLALLLIGRDFDGWLHGLLVVALVAFPWRVARGTS